MGPTMFYWMRFTATLFPGRSFRSSISRAVLEQFSYDPTAILVFLYMMTLFEGKSKEDAKQEVNHYNRLFNRKVAKPIEKLF